jgi:hypothetical protein
MKKRLGLAVATLGTALTLLTPATAMARDRDDWGRGRSHERHERHESEERWEHRDRRYRGGYYGGGYYYSAPSYGYGYGYQQPYYGNGYYNNGYYNQAPQGYYDRSGCYHPY